MPPHLDLIDLDQPGLRGYRRFISCWLSRGEGPGFVVDPGPASTAPLLLARLRELDVDRLDYILLTHIHLDHGGATPLLLDAFPDARVVCQTRAREHVMAPARLWEGSRAVLGSVAEVYGEPRPVPAEALASYEDLEADGIAVIPTPGHAPHHISFLHRGTLFVGEAAGTFLDLGDGRWYLRPATPPRFLLTTALESLDRLLALEPEPARLAFAHHGLLTGRTRELLGRSRDQLVRWVDTVRALRREHPGLGFDPLAARIEARLLERDPELASRGELPEDIQRREEDFTRQTLRGMVQYVEETPGG
jgi:glyoxylase-like metal-dependent hydrolase (beta-lactamase superfamily II)